MNTLQSTLYVLEDPGKKLFLFYNARSGFQYDKRPFAKH